MKKMMLAAMFVMLAAANTFAFSDSIQLNKEKSFDLVLSQVSNSTQIILKDKHHNILFETTLQKGEDFAKTFNLELVADGTYTVEIENETKIKVIGLVVDENAVYTAESMQSEIYKPVLAEKGSVVYLNQFAPDHAPLYVAIYNNRNELIHEETLEGKVDLGKKFDFSKSYNGQYRFYMESNGMSYDQLVYVEK